MASATTQVEKTARRQREALEALAEALVAHGEPAGAPFARFAVPSLPVLLVLDPDTTADWGIKLVRGIFCNRGNLPNAVTEATKDVGNAARAVRRTLERAKAKRAGWPTERRGASRLAA